MNTQPIKSYRTYLMLHSEMELFTAPKQPPPRIVAIEEVAGERRRWEFYTLEQVTNFLGNEFFGQPGEVEVHEE
ncbi:MAG: hypothetical protein HS126_29960 [Anaerolineales bacterium]|nr:hypothetical protein [Anaerolineales bacterium]